MMNDVISREWLKIAIHNFYYGLKHIPTEEDIQAYIDAAPSAQPERMRGKWIIDRGLYKCSCCKQLWAEWWAVSKPIERMNKEMPYCPMCGADMRGEQDDKK